MLVGALAGPWAGALTGLLSNLIWSILPVPGGAGPTAAFFAPVAGGHRPDGRLLGRAGASSGSDPTTPASAASWRSRPASRPPASRCSSSRRRSGSRSLASTIRTPTRNQNRFVAHRARARRDRRRRRLAVSGAPSSTSRATTPGIRTVPHRRDRDLRVRPDRSRCSALLFGPTGYFSTVDGLLTTTGTPDSFLGGANLTSLALADPLGLIVALVVAVLVAFGSPAWARRGENARLFPVWVGGLTTGLVAALISAPIAAGVFGGVTGGGTDALVALFRTLGLERAPVGVRAGPDQRPARQDDQLHDRLPHPRRPADHGPNDVQPRRGRPSRRVARRPTAPLDRPRADGRRMSTATGYFVAGSSWLHRRYPLTKLLGLGFVLVAAFLLPPIVLAGPRGRPGGDRLVGRPARADSPGRCASRPSC